MAGPTGVPGYLKPRERPGPEALLGLARHHAAGACADGDYRTHGGMLLVATRGPASDVPTNAETIARWDGSSGHGRDQATMGLSGAFDVVNRQMLGLAVRRGGFDERAEVPGHAGAVADAVGGLPLALVMDRGYPSLPLMATLSDMGVPHAARRRRSSTGAGSGACEAAGGGLRPGPGLTDPGLRSAHGVRPGRPGAPGGPRAAAGALRAGRRGRRGPGEAGGRHRGRRAGDRRAPPGPAT